MAGGPGVTKSKRPDENPRPEVSVKFFDHCCTGPTPSPSDGSALITIGRNRGEAGERSRVGRRAEAKTVSGTKKKILNYFFSTNGLLAIRSRRHFANFLKCHTNLCQSQ